jgi:proteasome alpha subunit
VRPFGVSLILGGVVNNTPQLYLTDPSGTYLSYDAIAIGAGSEDVTNFLEKTYKNDLSLDEASALATAGIYLSSEDKEGADHIRMAHIKTETGLYEIIASEQIANYAKTAKEKYPHDQK